MVYVSAESLLGYTSVCSERTLAGTRLGVVGCGYCRSERCRAFLALIPLLLLLLSSALALSEISPGFEVSQSLKDDPNLILYDSLQLLASCLSVLSTPH